MFSLRRCFRLLVSVLVGLVLLGLTVLALLHRATPPYPQSPQFSVSDDRFVNSHPGLGPSFGSARSSEPAPDGWPRRPWPDNITNTTTPQLLTPSESDTLAVSWLGHSTYLLEFPHYRVLIDPIFSDTAGPTSWLGAYRYRPPGLTLDQLPPIDLILISHNHYDHLDLPTLHRLSDRDAPHIVVPLGDAPWLTTLGLQNVTELDWWQSFAPPSAPDCLTAHFTPTQHGSARGLIDRDRSLWGSFVITYGPQRFYHSGDTGYSPHFAAIGERFGPIDLALLSIGSYAPRDFLAYVHMPPDLALRAHADLQSQQSYGMHYDTFRLTALGFGEAIRDFTAAKTATPPSTPFDLLEVGQTIRLPLTRTCSAPPIPEV